MKRIIVLIIAATMLFALCACGKTKDAPAYTNSEFGFKITLPDGWSKTDIFGDSVEFAATDGEGNYINVKIIPSNGNSAEQYASTTKLQLENMGYIFEDDKIVTLGASSFIKITSSSIIMSIFNTQYTYFCASENYYCIVTVQIYNDRTASDFEAIFSK